MPSSAFGNAIDPLVSLPVYTGDVGLDDGTGASVYVLDKAQGHPADARPTASRSGWTCVPARRVTLPDGLGSVTFDGLERWNKIQISRTPGKLIALGGVVAALLGLLGSLFVRPRRLWVRARRQDDGTHTGRGGPARPLLGRRPGDRARRARLGSWQH